MANRIQFSNFDISADGWIRCNVTRKQREELAIRLPYSFVPAPDLIACVAASLCGTAFDHIEIDLPIGDGLATIIRMSTRATLKHLPGTDTHRRPGTAKALNFSGGFDSLAARELMPDAHLVSLDFGGRFSRERNFFSRFNPLTFETNLVDLGLNKYSWQFMGIGAILLRDELAIGTQAFGSIMAGSLPRLLAGPLDQQKAAIPAASALGITAANPVAGITETASLSLVAATNPSILPDALASVAAPGEDKYRRKYMMLEAVCSRLGQSVQLPVPPPPRRAVEWGASFATDISSLHVAQILGTEPISASYAGGMPPSVTEVVETLDLRFMDRVNPHAYAGVPSVCLAPWYSRLAEAGIFPFQRADWEAADVAVKVVSR